MFCSQCGTRNADEAKFCQNCGAPLMTTTPPAASTAPPVVHYAGFWRRFVAYFIDQFILSIPSVILVLLFIVPSIVGVVNCCYDAESLPLAIVSLVMSWVWLIILIALGHLLYFVWLESSRFQATLGKMLLGVIVTDMNGKRVSFFRALGRNLGKVISHMILDVGYMMAGWTSKKQALHDMMADCLVVMR